MKRLLTAALLALSSSSVFAATLNPVQLLNPAGSTAGQAIISTGASTAPAWGNVSAANVTGAATSGANTNITSLLGLTGQVLVTNLNLVTTQTTPNGSVGQGPIYTSMVRTGGFGQYGNWLSLYMVETPTPVGQFDNGITSWATNTNLTGGQIFGGWLGANSPAKNLGQTYSGGAAIGFEVNSGNRWASFGLQTNVGSPRYTVGMQSVPDVLPSSDGINTAAVTCTATSPGVCTLNSNGFYNNMGVVFGGTTVPGGLTAGTTYYAQNVATNTFQVSSTIGGAPINFSSTGSAVTILPSWPGNFAYVTAASIHGHQWWVGDNIGTDSIVPNGVGHLDNGGSTASDAPGNWAQVNGNWGAGLNCAGATFSSSFCVEMGDLQAIRFDATASMFGNSGTIFVAGNMAMGSGNTFTPSTTGGIVGTTLGDNAQAGSVGEYQTATTSGTSLSSGGQSNATSKSLAAGDWDVQCDVQFVPAGSTTVSVLFTGVSLTSATLGGLGTITQIAAPLTTGQTQYMASPIVRVNLATTTTVYCPVSATFGTSTMTVNGLLFARRVR
jgi:hypothetical protein